MNEVSVSNFFSFSSVEVSGKSECAEELANRISFQAWVDIHGRQESFRDLVKLFFVNRIHVDAFARASAQVSVVSRVKLKRFLWHSHDWDRHVFLLPYLRSVCLFEIVHVVDIRSEKADDPFVRPNVLVLFVSGPLLLIFGLRVLFIIIENKSVLPVISLLKSFLESVLHRVVLFAKVRDEVVFPLRLLLEHFLLDVLVICTTLEHNVSLRRILVHWDETEVVFIT